MADAPHHKFNPDLLYVRTFVWCDLTGRCTNGARTHLMEEA
jgi:hypothetical protein